MGPRRVALIGHSGAGKSACLEELGIDYKTADMDALGFSLSKSEADALRTLSRALDWLASSDTPRVVAVRNDEMMLKAMKDAKVRRRHREQFGCFFLVYFHNRLEDISEHLGGRTDADAVRYTINSYDRFHDELYTKLADETVECTGKSVETVAAEVRTTATRLLGEIL